MQSLDVISVNLWQILVSLLNLLILFLIIKKFLYKPAKRMLEARKNSIEKQYAEAETAKQTALADKQAYEEKLASAKNEADALIASAAATATAREQEIIAAAKTKAELITDKAKSDAELELKRAEQSIKDEIVSVSTALAEKILEREISADDHRNLIDGFINKLGEEDEQQ